ncbi:YadA C-terminal domain-containing protein [Glaesserella sp.]|uniref:YadA C-terminal domain-containing protein n=1 Tax=Glaesserella sp. TaxID=2094731 RepID=UPI00359FC069
MKTQSLLLIVLLAGTANANTNIAAQAQQQINKINTRIDKVYAKAEKYVRQVNRQAQASGATAHALSSVEGYLDSVGVGIGAYRREQAVAIGYATQLGTNGAVRLSVSMDSTGGLGGGLGYNFQW